MLRGLFEGAQYNSEAWAKCAVYLRARTKQGHRVIKVIRYVERRTTDLETDFSESLSTLKVKQKDTLRVVVYCRTLMICAALFSRFSYEMGKVSTTLLVHLN